MRKYLILLVIFSAICTFVVYAKPTINDKTSATLAFTMWDLKTDKSYVVDLEISVDKTFSHEIQSFEIDLKKKINSAYPGDIEDFNLVRWGILGSIQAHDGYGGYAASYDLESSPDDAAPYPWIAQRINRIGTYMNSGIYSDGDNNHQYEISLRELGDTTGHYATGWQGNINGLTKSDLEGKVSDKVSKMHLWSVHMEKIEIDKKTMRVIPNYITKNHGQLTLTSNGKLIFVRNDET